MVLKERYEGDILYYEFNPFKDIDFIKHIFTSRIGWNIENALNNLSNIFNVPRSNIISLRQVHGSQIRIIDGKMNDHSKLIGREGDGLITNISNIVLITYHADCVPIYFLDKKKKIVGLAHGGWRGSFDNISGRMVHTLTKEYNSQPEDILAAIGPSIGPCCYEISKDLGHKFAEKYRNFDNILIKKKNNIYLDLWRLNYLQLRAKGIMNKNITLSNSCTSCNIDKFYSYRREKGTNNRMVAAISLTKD